MSDKYYKQVMYECKSCGKVWNTPGTAELCWKKDRLLELLKKVDNHKTFYLDDVIDDIEQKIKQGEYDE